MRKSGRLPLSSPSFTKELVRASERQQVKKKNQGTNKVQGRNPTSPCPWESLPCTLHKIVVGGTKTHTGLEKSLCRFLPSQSPSLQSQRGSGGSMKPLSTGLLSGSPYHQSPKIPVKGPLLKRVIRGKCGKLAWMRAELAF